MKINKAIITAAGFGSRFLPITKTIPKEMLPIGDKPIIHHIVKECADAGLSEIIIVAAPEDVRTFEDYFYGHGENIKRLMYRQGKIDRWKKVEEIFSLPLVTVIPEDRTIPYGNGRPILSARDLVKDEDGFIVCWGDDLVLSEVSGVKQLVDFATGSTYDAVIGIQEVSSEDILKYSSVKIAEGTEDKVEYMIEKPNPGEAPTNLASYGRYVLTNKIYEHLTSESTGKDGEVWLPDAIAKVVQNGDVRCKIIDGVWYTTGDPANYLSAQNAYFNKYK